MKAQRRRRTGRSRSAIEILEESVALLRRWPQQLLWYYLGAVPFIGALLMLGADLLMSSIAERRIGSYSLILALLFIWMKCWHAFFLSQLSLGITGRAGTPWNPARVWRLVVTQAAIQPFGLFVRPLCGMFLLPYGWSRAFFENALVYGDGSETAGDVMRKSLAQSTRENRQNHGVMSWLTVGAGAVWLNVFTGVIVMPFVLKQLFGIESWFTEHPALDQSPMAVAVATALTYLCINPVTKCVYLLRCFYGDAQTTGEDLLVKIREWQRVAACLVLGLVATLGTVNAAPEAVGRTGAIQVSPDQLDNAAKEVLSQREFAWRLPREVSQKKTQSNWFESWLEDTVAMVRGWYRAVNDFFRTLREFFRKKDQPEKPHELLNIPWDRYVRPVSFFLLGLSLLLLAFLVYRRVRMSVRREVFHAEAIPSVPDLTVEDISPTQLPEQGWLDLATELRGRGELRLALRAIYLAGLAHLGGLKLVQLARHKSNRDYDRELVRRGKDRPVLIHAFRENATAFERAWYGYHRVTEETLDRSQANMERMRGE